MPTKIPEKISEKISKKIPEKFKFFRKKIGFNTILVIITLILVFIALFVVDRTYQSNKASYQGIKEIQENIHLKGFT